MKEKRLVGYFVLLVFSLILFVVLSNFASAAIAVVSPANNFNYTGTAVFNVSFTNGTDYPNNILNATFYYNLSGVWTYFGFTTDCNINNGVGAGSTNFSSCNATLSLPANSEARYSINATLGNNTLYGASTITTNVMFDSKAPAVSFSGITNTINYGNYSGSIVINVSVIDNGMGVNRVYFNITNSSGVEINWTRAINSGDYYNITLDTTAFVEGFYNVSVYANDTQLNNLNKTERIQITIDRTAPVISLSKSSSTTNSMVVSYSCSDATSGIESCTLSSSSGTISGSTISDLNCASAYTITVSTEDNTGNTASSSQSFSTEGCGGIITPSLPKKVISFTLITPGAVAIVKNFDSKIGVKEIQIEVNNPAQNVKITVTKYDEKPTDVSVEKTGSVYKYLHVKTINLEDKLKKANMRIQVEKSWVAGQGINKEDVVLFKYDETANKWNELTTEYSNEDNTYYYYDVELNSFSYFAIGEKTQVIPEEETITDITETLTKNYLWVWIIIIVVVLVTIFFLFKKIKKKKRK